LVPAPWYVGRVLLIGDAAHATTPHLASGAGIGVEDAVVLGQEVAKASTAEQALAAFMTRRFERCRMVVENSVRLGDLEAKGGAIDEHQSLMRDSMSALLAPI
jgi:2-polyprenyl-6-methoxyphenol hydroxylase-like FAD-dependent oxidoreductase